MIASLTTFMTFVFLKNLDLKLTISKKTNIEFSLIVVFIRTLSQYSQLALSYSFIADNL